MYRHTNWSIRFDFKNKNTYKNLDPDIHLSSTREGHPKETHFLDVTSSSGS